MSIIHEAINVFLKLSEWEVKTLSFELQLMVCMLKLLGERILVEKN